MLHILRLSLFLGLLIICKALTTDHERDGKGQFESIEEKSKFIASQIRHPLKFSGEKVQSMYLKGNKEKSLQQDVVPGYFATSIALFDFGGTTYSVEGVAYGICVTSTNTTTGNPIYYQISEPVLSDGIYTITRTEYTDSTCSTANSVPPTSQSVPASENRRNLYFCQSFSTPINITNSIVSGSDYSSSIATASPGPVTLSYLDMSSCSSQITPYGYSAEQQTICGTDWGQCFYSLQGISTTVGSYKGYSDSTCQKLVIDSTIYYNTSCAVFTVDDDDNDNDGDDDDNYLPTTYYIQSYQGVFGSDDDDNVSLSQAEYGVLIFFVFFAFAVGGCLGYAIYMFTTRPPEPMAKDTEIGESGVGHSSA